MADTPLIYSKITAIMKSVEAIGKSRRNVTQNFDFRGIDEVMNELHEIFANNEVFVIPEVVNYSVTEFVTSKGTQMHRSLATIKHRYITTDGSFVETTTVGEAMDSGDKGMNKAMSIALKYSLIQMLLIPTKDPKDPDATTPDETVQTIQPAQGTFPQPNFPQSQFPR